MEYAGIGAAVVTFLVSIGAVWKKYQTGQKYIKAKMEKLEAVGRELGEGLERTGQMVTVVMASLEDKTVTEDEVKAIILTVKNVAREWAEVGTAVKAVFRKES